MQGGWEADETVEAAAARETVEEAGVRGVLEVYSLLDTYFFYPVGSIVCFSDVCICLQTLSCTNLPTVALVMGTAWLYKKNAPHNC